MTRKPKKVWCAQHRDGWCATASGKPAAPEMRREATLCGYSIILPYGTAKRTPDCPDCLKVLDA